MRLAAVLLVIGFFVAATTSAEAHRKRRRRREFGDDDAPAVVAVIADEDDDYDDGGGGGGVGDGGEEKPTTSEEERLESMRTAWMNHEHPERRSGRYIGEEQTEFVRTEYTDAVYNKVRTYSTGALPRQVECFSCMSLSYQTSWKYLQATYNYPKVFTDRCRDPSSERGMPTVMCGSVCVSLMEPDVEAGVFIGFKHIRGCLDRVLRHGFNQSALRTHRFHQNNQCRTLNRAALFNPARATDPPAIGDVQLCSCYGDRCNSCGRLRWSAIFAFLVLLATNLLI